ncbi:hypothetical protein DFR70_103686 [Nocardia tenerifensis]|uniref:Uncharacterized protein n=1 Tax=Nocardia tenerifensis TaxID=228006 RepID=A0A318K521_9NOCA|nr:hypothetical protein [Nocardia tenerifensis]PXX66931.1 hypothetical protein DFR70_103686 [Nocardia tenerifensis]
MNPNLIRPVLVGVAAGMGVFATLYALIEFDPWDTLAEHAARRQLTPGERAELDRLDTAAREQAARYRELIEHDEHAHAERAAAGFNPDLLSVAMPVGSPRELDLAQLVAEIVHAEHSYRHGDAGLVYPHREALYQEFRRRDDWRARAVASRVDRLRLDIACDRVKTARAQPLLSDSAPVALPSFEGDSVYRELGGSDVADPKPGW